MELILDFSKEFDDTLNNFYIEINNFWNIIKNEIKEYIYQILDKVFKEKFESLIDISFNETLNNISNISQFKVEVVDRNNEIINTIIIDINNINISYGYSLKRLGNYDFIMDVYTGGNITLEINSNIYNLISEKIKGELGSGIIGVTGNYSLHNFSLDINCYGKFNEINYNVNLSSIENMESFKNSNVNIQKYDFSKKRKINSKFYELE